MTTAPSCLKLSWLLSALRKKVYFLPGPMGLQVLALVLLLPSPPTSNSTSFRLVSHVLGLSHMLPAIPSALLFSLL